MSLLDQSFTIDGTSYRLVIVDERPEMDLDPTLGLFREGQEEPIATIHFRDGRCGDPEHISVGAPYSKPCRECGYERDDEGICACDDDELEAGPTGSSYVIARGRFASLDEDPQDEDDGMVLVAGQLYDAESGELVEDEA